MACLSSGMSLANHWTPEGANYSGVMSVYSVIQINDIEQYSDQLEVGAFCGDECRGSAIAGEFYLTHRYLAILTIYGETGHQLTFKLYDHNTGQEYEPASQETITFIEDGYGNPIEPYILNFNGASSGTTQTITLSQGWNWFSTYIEADDLLEQLEEALGENGISIESKDDGMTEFDGEEWFGDLDDVGITNEQMYLIQTSTACTIQLHGTPANAASHPITINPGWNWIGYPCAQEMNIADAFAGFEAEEGDQLESKAGYTEFDGEDWFGEIETLTPGQGFLYYSNSAVPKTLIFQMSRKQ